LSKGEIVGTMAIAEMTQIVKVVIDGNRLVMEHAQENWQKKLDDDRAISKWGCGDWVPLSELLYKRRPFALGYSKKKRE
jgi:hypothetical protein